jgi:hypothetical protein
MLGVEEGIKDCPPDCPLPPEAIREQAKTIIEVLSVLKSITIEGYRKGDLLIQHGQAKVKDID